MKTPASDRAGWFAIALSAMVSIDARAQTSPPPIPGETVSLSPFVINADAETGYAPNETLSGTRLRTQTRDVASALTIVTSEFLHDVGATSFNDVLDFLPSTSSYANNDGDQFNNGSRTGTPFIVRGYRSDSLSTDFFSSLTPVDSYNTSRFTFSRGPNSILFGVGNPGGVLDVATNRPTLGKDSAKLELRADTFDSFRSAVDANVTLRPGKLGLRFDAVHDDRGSNIKPSENRRDSAYLALRYQPDHATTIDVNFESAQFHQKIPRSVVAFDWYDTWLAAGSPLVATAGATTALNGVEFQVTNGYPVFIPGVGGLDWSRSALGARPLINGTRDAQVSFGASSRALPISFDTYAAGDGDRVRLNNRNVSALIQRRLADGLNLELGAKHEYSFRQNWESQGTGADNAVKVDANRQLPNGQPNPNAGLPYIEQTANYTNLVNTEEQVRATLSYEKDFSSRKLFNRGLGQFTLAALCNNDALHNYNDNFRQVNETPLAISTTDLSNARNLIRRRSYLTGGNHYFTSDFALFNGNGITAGWEPVNTPRNNFTRTQSYALASQAVLLDHLLVITGGLRRDEALVGQYNFTKDARGLYTVGGSHGGSPAPDLNSIGRPYLLGAVLNPTKNVSLFANSSTNFQPVNQSYRTINGDPLAAVRGRGFDGGAKFFLFGDRVSGSIDYFETQQTNVRDSTVNSTNMVNWISAIWSALDNSKNPDPAWTDTKIAKTHGLEFQLVANATKNLRLMFNLSRDINVLQDHGATTYAYLAQNIPGWLARGSTPVSSPDGSTVSALVARLQQEESDQLRVIGTRQTRVYEWQANFVGRYQLDGVLPWKGFAAGSALRWRNAPVIGFARTGTLLDATRPFKGRPFSNADAWIEYVRTLTLRERKVRWSTEVRAQNLADNRGLQLWTATDDGTGHPFIEQRRTPGERQISLSTSFSL
jgi:outer membrane receptor for ferric coprogen and ferric-rhodotorulic acid